MGGRGDFGCRKCCGYFGEATNCLLLLYYKQTKERESVPDLIKK